MEKKQKLDLTKFEVMVETQHGLLIGGFSFAATNPTTDATDPVTNNCNGGNCVAGCAGQTNKLLCL